MRHKLERRNYINCMLTDQRTLVYNRHIYFLHCENEKTLDTILVAIYFVQNRMLTANSMTVSMIYVIQYQFMCTVYALELSRLISLVLESKPKENLIIEVNRSETRPKTLPKQQNEHKTRNNLYPLGSY